MMSRLWVVLLLATFSHVLCHKTSRGWGRHDSSRDSDMDDDSGMAGGMDGDMDFGMGFGMGGMMPPNMIPIGAVKPECYTHRNVEKKTMTYPDCTEEEAAKCMKKTCSSRYWWLRWFCSKPSCCENKVPVFEVFNIPKQICCPGYFPVMGFCLPICMEVCSDPTTDCTAPGVCGPVCRPKCENGGSCLEGTATCLCTREWTGQYCQERQTAPVTCNLQCDNGGSCANDGTLEGAEMCICAPGFVGLRCESPDDGTLP